MAIVTSFLSSCFLHNFGKGVNRVPTDIAQELRQAEETAKKLVEDAKVKANSILEEARAKADEILKDAKAKARNHYREIVQKAQAKAEERARTLIEEGKKRISSQRNDYAAKVDKVAALVVEEVMKRYGNS